MMIDEHCYLTYMLTQSGDFCENIRLNLTYLVPNKWQTSILSSDKVITFMKISG